MYSYEDRMKAVQLYITYGRSAAAVVRELGYPSRKNLRRWYHTYVKTGGLPEGARPKPKYSIGQKQMAVDHYLVMGVASPETQERWDIRVSRCLESGLMSSTPARGSVSLARLGA